jgi:hypothetical protein
MLRRSDCLNSDFCTERLHNGDKAVLQLKRESVDPKKHHKLLGRAGGKTWRQAECPSEIISRGHGEVVFLLPFQVNVLQ